MSHGHSHGGGGCRCAAEREEPPEQRGLAYGLYLRIDLERLQCLNESREGSGRGVFKPWEERTDRSKFVESDADEELLFNIPFTGNVKLKGIIIMGEDDDSHPSEMRLYKNIPQMSFDDTDREPDQTFSLNRDLTGELEYATKISRFSNVYHLSIHISKNFGADTTKVLYIGLRGEWTEVRRGGKHDHPPTSPPPCTYICVCIRLYAVIWALQGKEKRASEILLTSSLCIIFLGFITISSPSLLTGCRYF
ncbi:PITH domain-containing protein 1 isoform X1 [Neomonachus schauinslandi]|uniref:PITH domain-containing protein 1 n=1 Tax=Neomonachus schauinslandi TaxID=29088 RepID=A0A8M1MBC6_NEOSC|nr:PITH domain-containing protein 1 isoform X1 [Neomonachus schauinslandi]